MVIFYSALNVRRREVMIKFKRILVLSATLPTKNHGLGVLAVENEVGIINNTFNTISLIGVSYEPYV